MNFLPHTRSQRRLDRLMLAATLLLCLLGAITRASAQDEPGQQPAATQAAPTGQQPQQPVPPEQPRTRPDSPQLPDSPFRDLFVRPKRDTGQTLTFSLAGYGGYDSNVVGDQQVASAGIDPRAQGGGSSVLGTAGASDPPATR
jgi:hypothetical protein